MKYFDIEEFVYVNRISKKDLAEYIGVSPSYVSQIINGERALSEERLAKLLAHPTWDTAPLLARAREEQPTYEPPLNLAPIPAVAPPTADGKVVEAETVELPIVPTAVVRLPDVRLSKWIDKYSDEVERLKVSEIVRSATMVREVKERDMCPTLKMGQYIYLEQMPKEMPIKNGKIYFIDHKKLGGFFRRIYDREENIECRADNSAYEPNIFPKEDIYDIYRVVGVFSTDIIEDGDAAAKDQHIAQLMEQTASLIEQQNAHNANTRSMIEQSRELVAQQGVLIELLKNK